MGEDGVTLYAFGQRIGMFCDEIAARYTGERVAVVSHAGTIDAAVRWALGIGADSPWQHELEVQHASITEVEFWPRGRIIGGSPRYAVLRRLGHTAHLGEFLSDL
jgi:broad specificity phosphatase PhoE